MVPFHKMTLQTPGKQSKDRLHNGERGKRLEAEVQYESHLQYSRSGVCLENRGARNHEEGPLLESYSEDDANQNDEDSDDMIIEEYLEPGESSFKILIQCFIPYLFSGLGFVLTGVMLDYVQVGIYHVYRSQSSTDPRSAYRSSF
jgi:hypothetical protein